MRSSGVRNNFLTLVECATKTSVLHEYIYIYIYIYI